MHILYNSKSSSGGNNKWLTFTGHFVPALKVSTLYYLSQWGARREEKVKLIIAWSLGGGKHYYEHNVHYHSKSSLNTSRFRHQFLWGLMFFAALRAPLGHGCLTSPFSATQKSPRPPPLQGPALRQPSERIIWDVPIFYVRSKHMLPTTEEELQVKCVNKLWKCKRIHLVYVV